MGDQKDPCRPSTLSCSPSAPEQPTSGCRGSRSMPSSRDRWRKRPPSAGTCSRSLRCSSSMPSPLAAAAGTFVVVGAGPPGVELAGALSEPISQVTVCDLPNPGLTPPGSSSWKRLIGCSAPSPNGSRSGRRRTSAAWVSDVLIERGVTSGKRWAMATIGRHAAVAQLPIPATGKRLHLTGVVGWALAQPGSGRWPQRHAAHPERTDSRCHGAGKVLRAPGDDTRHEQREQGR
jgi:hypothetical protein